ncbi:hypothetical protein EHW99_0058 [Erwinia amylovora]|uniref:Uncharacterized protein n=2 Tax=Erwinia amylovora TaxID=552 RepID=A0A831EQM2_ERWAM|nr:hypothetical protein EHX00_0058 [Erwinia amylovora]CBA19000.1 hypothetical protein predicted by Glimmer/Critica [Erwinia amylovora CFBP1430]CCO76908.1 hypothetical protein BN432_0060 [Erwinia amylovora Ea356]CCO80687.1 hypothetical protein BN433_0065 [Erwinia amylovora Ea266]CCO84499.1 hypothetical protein BN434_0060 [Erwinia amylovora CFBP 2585]CCO88283.1 hypothetical protein BN435_0060 [Erwinia amylovora 01SFR-BO]CCO92040.1 hypothetical protein BN437_0059 [Erwinia amylovora NBRC 12687 = 
MLIASKSLFDILDLNVDLYKIFSKYNQLNVCYNGFLNFIPI